MGSSIVKTKRMLVAFLGLLPWLPKSARADSLAPTVPPSRNFGWDVSRKDSLIEKEFLVKEYRGYDFAIGFGSKISPNDPDQSWREDERNWEFIKGGRLRQEDGTSIPVLIRIDRLDIPDAPVRIVEQQVDTKSIYSGGRLVVRLIVKVPLRPGLYRVSAKVLRDVALPEGLGTYLHIGFHPKATVIKE